MYFGSWNAEHNGGWCGGAGDNGTASAGPWVMVRVTGSAVDAACYKTPPPSLRPAPIARRPTALQADLEDGLWACGTPGAANPAALPLRAAFVTAMVKGGTNGFGVKQGDATRGNLTKTYEGPRPPGYQPMKKQARGEARAARSSPRSSPRLLHPHAPHARRDRARSFSGSAATTATRP